MGAGRRLLAGLAVAGLASVGIGAALRRALPPQGRMLRVGDQDWHLIEAGPPDAPPVLMIYGMAGQAANFWRLFPDLSRDFRLIAIDRPGAGHSGPPPPGGARLAPQAASIGRLVDTLGLKDALVLGHSLGGVLSLRLALDRPDLVRGLLLVGAYSQHEPGRGGALGRWAASNPAGRMAVSLLGPSLAMPLMGPWLMRQLFAPERADWALMTRGDALLGAQPGAIRAVGRDFAIVAQDMPQLQADLPGLAPPVIALHGDGDRIVPVQQSQVLARMVPHTRLYVVPGGGHMLPITQPGLTCGLLRDLAQMAGV